MSRNWAKTDISAPIRQDQLRSIENKPGLNIGQKEAQKPCFNMSKSVQIGSKLGLTQDFTRLNETIRDQVSFGPCLRYLIETFLTFGSRLIYLVKTFSHFSLVLYTLSRLFLVGSHLVSASEGLVSSCIRPLIEVLPKKCRT